MDSNSRNEQQQPNRRVGPYEILRKVARGGMATVYLARQTQLDRLVALKELAALPDDEPELAERFVRESRMAGMLNHPNIVAVYDFFECDGRGHIAMEYLERGSLRPYVGRIGVAQVMGVLEGVLAALDHAEAHGIVHRDLKPENVLVTTEGGVKLADFGIAKALNSMASGEYRTETGAIIGTPAYMSPEQAIGDVVGPASDLYAVGVIAYEMLAGELPYGCPTDIPMAVLVRHVHDPVPEVAEVLPDLDPRLAAWVQRLLAKDPAERPPRAMEAWREAEEIVADLYGPLWRRGGCLNGAPAAGSATSREARDEPPSAALSLRYLTPAGGDPRVPRQPFRSLPAPPAKSTRLSPERPAPADLLPAFEPLARAERAPIRAFRRRLATLLATLVTAGAAAAALVAFTGSGSATLDLGEVRAAITAELDAANQVADMVDCPASVPLERGFEFACTVTLEGSVQELQATVTQTDGAGGFDVVVGLR
jgi:hypothetical protein